MDFIFRAVVSTLLIYTASVKWMDLRGFISQLEGTISNSFLLTLIAYFIPAFEFVLATSIWIGSVRKEAAFLIATLFFVFISYISYLWAAGYDPNCRCFGKDFSFSSHANHILFNSFILLLAVLIALRKEKKSKLR